MPIIAKLQALAQAMTDIVALAPQVETALTSLNTFLDSIT